MAAWTVSYTHLDVYKRQIVFSVAVLVVFCWLFAIIAILIKVDDPKGPVFFSQERVGKDGRTFRMLKFRSMCVDAEDKLAELRELNEKTGPVFKIAEDPRITRVGKWLRKLSLDELPLSLIHISPASSPPARAPCRTDLQGGAVSVRAPALPAGRGVPRGRDRLMRCRLHGFALGCAAKTRF